MDINIARKIVGIQDFLREDAQYRELLAEYAVRQERMLEWMKNAQEDQKAVVMDYLGIAIEMHLRMLELACSREW